MVLKRSFDWMARPYAALEHALFGGTFQRMRTSLIPELDASHRVLVLGEGDGRFVATLLARNPHVRVVVVDGSADMLRKAAERCSGLERSVSFVHANAVEWLETCPWTEPFDAVVTTFFLDCLTRAELDRLFVSIERRVTCDARWLWVDLVVPTHGWARSFARTLLRFLYAVFALTTDITARGLTDPSSHFAKHGWSSLRTERALVGVIEARSFVRS